MTYGSTYVDEKYSSIVEPNLYGDAVLQPKKTYNDVHQGDAKSGLVKVYKTVRDDSADPGQPAGDFEHENAANTLIDIRLNNAFRRSKKIYQVTANAVSYSLGEETLSTAVKDNQEDWQYAGLACLTHEGTIKKLSAQVTADNIKKVVITARKALRKKHARPDTVIASVDLYSTMLEAAGKDYTPSQNENTLTTGRVGTWLGMTWYEGDLLDKAAAKYYDHAGTLQTEDLTQVELIMYDHLAYHIVDNLHALRIVDATDFTGSYAQNEINTGYRVSNPDMVMVLKKADADCTLSGLSIGSVTLTPAFDPATTSYTAATSNATNTITATAADPNATVAIDVDGTATASGSSATWAAGANTVTVVVSNSDAEKAYTVVVTKS